jgi:small-conductance mechanosensitive channel/CRP-like cAMP-binding protein
VLALAAVALIVWAVVRNSVIRHRLRLTLAALAAGIVLHGWLLFVATGGAAHQAAIPMETLALSLAAISLGVAVLLNPWFADRVPDRVPSIVQDAIVVALFVVVAVYGIGEQAWITSTAVAALVGFALQDQLANAFAGLAIQVEKPFRVGHWVSVGDHEGRVSEVTWRATKIHTKSGNHVILPNSLVAQAAVFNYSEPAVPTRIAVEVGATYLVPPNEARDAILTAMRRVPRVLAHPPADVVFKDFGDSALIYQARFWIDDFARDEPIRHEVRTAIYYEFHRRDIEIPWPITVEYKRQEISRDTPQIREGYQHAIAAVAVFAALPVDAHEALAAAARSRLFANGEVVVREGDHGASMFIVRSGRVAVSVGEELHEVAVTQAGGYFGEMSLLTGDTRAATVTARGDCELLEIAADDFGVWVRSHPDVIEALAESAADRRREVEAQRPEQSAPAAEPISLAQRMRKFFRIGSGR